MVLEMVALLSDNAEEVDIVWTAWKHAAVHKRTELILQINLNITYWPSSLYP